MLEEAPGDAACRKILRTVLNPEQFRAATTTEGPLLILAGAGSGKTRVLVHRIAYILETQRAQPWEIFAVTFTNKAAQEMRRRLEALLGSDLGNLWIGTFHSLAARFLRREAHHLGYDRSFTIYDADDSKRLLKKVLRELGTYANPEQSSLSAIANEIDRAKNRGLTVDAFLRTSAGQEGPAKGAARAAYPKYQSLLERSNAMDFGDLLLQSVELLKRYPEVKETWSRRFRYFLVDEFQDTNQVQYALLEQLVEPDRNLGVVGDDDQAIYRWRGAEVRHILGFQEKYAEASVIKLEENYRSTGHILQAANAVIAKNKGRHKKALKTQKAAGKPIGLHICHRSEEEAHLIANAIHAGIRAGQSPSDFAVLYRQNAQSRLFEEAFRRARLKYVLIGGMGFYERREVKDIVAYLRITANPSSQADFDRIANTPGRGLGERTLEKLRAIGQTHQCLGAHALALPEDILRNGGLKTAQIRKLQTLGHTLERFRAHATECSATEVAHAIIQETEYMQYLVTSEPATAEDRGANVAELISSIAEHEANPKSRQSVYTTDDDPTSAAPFATAQDARSPLQAFLDEAALASAVDEEGQGASVSLLTLHSAKGLEFPTVFMAGMEEQTFPSRQAVEGGQESMEEERRLCYVGFTRAMHELNLSAAKNRRIYGREEYREPSRFLGDLPKAIVGPFPAAPKMGFGAPHNPPSHRHKNPHRRTVSRGEDRIEYDEPTRHGRPLTPPNPSRNTHEIEPENPYRIGARIQHNTFGEGLVQGVDGVGPNARLTIQFPDFGSKTVVARFVRSVDESW